MESEPITLWFRRALTVFGFGLLLAVIATVATLRAQTPPSAIDYEMPQTVLLQVRDDDQQGYLNILLADEGKSWFVIPSAVVVRQGADVITLSESATAINQNASQSALSASLDIEIDEIWQINRLGLAAYLESIGGNIRVNPREETTLPVSDGELTLAAGQTALLSGTLASHYVVDLQNLNEFQKSRRFVEVWAQLMNRLDGATLPEILSSIGSASRSSLPQLELINYVEKVQSAWSVGRPPVIVLATITATYQGQPQIYLTTKARQRLLAAKVRERITP